MAVVTDVVAKVAIGDADVLHAPTAERAEVGIRRVIRRITTDGGITNAKPNGRCRPTVQCAHRWVIGVQDETQVVGTWQRGDRISPLLRDRVDLAVAIQLISEQVRDDEYPGTRVPQHPWHRGFVRLEDANRVRWNAERAGKACVAEQCRQDPPGQVRTTGVVDRGPP